MRTPYSLSLGFLCGFAAAAVGWFLLDRPEPPVSRNVTGGGLSAETAENTPSLEPDEGGAAAQPPSARPGKEEIEFTEPVLNSATDQISEKALLKARATPQQISDLKDFLKRQTDTLVAFENSAKVVDSSDPRTLRVQIPASGMSSVEEYREGFKAALGEKLGNAAFNSAHLTLAVSTGGFGKNSTEFVVGVEPTGDRFSYTLTLKNEDGETIRKRTGWSMKTLERYAHLFQFKEEESP